MVLPDLAASIVVTENRLRQQQTTLRKDFPSLIVEDC